MRLTRHAEGVHTVAVPQRFLSFEVGTRATIVELPSGGLWVHSPVPLDDALRDEIGALGDVEHIVCPNVFHHLHAAAWVAAYPGARLHGPSGLARKRRDLIFDADLTQSADPSWGGAFVPTQIRGSMFQETVFVHTDSSTLISSDLMENLVERPDFATKIWGRLGDPYGTRLFRLFYHRRKQARADFARLLDQRFDRFILAHGEVFETGGKDKLAHGVALMGLAWPAG